MRVRGLGTDIVAVKRFSLLLQDHRARFRRRCFSAEEWAALVGWAGDEASGVAAGWAAKEAFLKALATRVTSIGYRQIEVRVSGQGAAELVLHGSAQAAFLGTGAQRVSLQLSRTGQFAQAVVVLEGDLAADLP